MSEEGKEPRPLSTACTELCQATNKAAASNPSSSQIRHTSPQQELYSTPHSRRSKSGWQGSIGHLLVEDHALQIVVNVVHQQVCNPQTNQASTPQSIRMSQQAAATSIVHSLQSSASCMPHGRTSGSGKGTSRAIEIQHQRRDFLHNTKPHSVRVRSLNAGSSRHHQTRATRSRQPQKGFTEPRSTKRLSQSSNADLGLLPREIGLFQNGTRQQLQPVRQPVAILCRQTRHKFRPPARQTKACQVATAG